MIKVHGLICDRDAECETIAWPLSVDYDVLREDVGDMSEYYKCTAKDKLLAQKIR